MWTCKLTFVAKATITSVMLILSGLRALTAAHLDSMSFPVQSCFIFRTPSEDVSERRFIASYVSIVPVFAASNFCSSLASLIHQNNVWARTGTRYGRAGFPSRKLCSIGLVECQLVSLQQSMGRRKLTSDRRRRSISSCSVRRRSCRGCLTQFQGTQAFH